MTTRRHRWNERVVLRARFKDGLRMAEHPRSGAVSRAARPTVDGSRRWYSARVDDDITQAVLSRDEVARYLRGGPGLTPDQAHQQISAYLEELRTTQRYAVYRTLKHPLYPILRKVQRHPEHVEVAQAATRSNRVVYASNHKSHLDYLIELLVRTVSSTPRITRAISTI